MILTFLCRVQVLALNSHDEMEKDDVSKEANERIDCYQSLQSVSTAKTVKSPPLHFLAWLTYRE